MLEFSGEVNCINGGTMLTMMKTPLDVMDDLYTLAYWMTGVEMSANELVNATYLSTDIDASPKDLFRIFRICYLEWCGFEGAPGFPDSGRHSKMRHPGALRRRFADMKLSVLLSEICGLKHQDISEIIGMPVEILRSRLSWGRKLLVGTLRMMPPVERNLMLTGEKLP
ncbi:MAG: RNA polymerase subunit sigma-24 [Chlorobiaceae bacterium]|jgi:hypothetical protein|nr:RNA polymerase subunit sigma-24 [Chlorobiaceae bacterium]